MTDIEALKSITTESIDLENVPVEEVFQHLKCTKEGLTSKEVQERLTLFGYNKLEEKKRMTAIEEMAGMDVLCSDKTGTLTLNKLTVDKNLIEIFKKGIDKDMAVLMAARAARLENQDAIDTAIVSMLSDPKEARAGIKELHFLPFSPANRRTALTYLDGEGKMHRVSKGAPEEILDMAHNKLEIKEKVHAKIDKFAERGLRSLGLAYQQVPDGDVKGEGGPWDFVALLPLFDPPRHDSAQTIERALHLGVSVKMITGTKHVFTISQALIFVTRSRSWSFVERPGFLLVIAFLIAQLVASVIAAMATWPFAGIRSIGWGWTGVIWVFNIVTYMLLDPIKFLVRYALSGKSWNRMVEQRTALNGKNNFGKDERMAAWASETRTQHGLETGQKPMHERNGATKLSSLAD
ncbi:hypothetical protein BRARA_D00167 [Brassica rapa]|uniref:Cation-transporting P-type ATPase N-terminal domain-containing protein n=1 Tax=Brassica campestris TaxID=3711 RepID=A0A397ZQN4_BRACM|nr:hypothetical protein BRARA_D00167 [Brassica rapa]